MATAIRFGALGVCRHRSPKLSRIYRVLEGGGPGAVPKASWEPKFG